MYNGIGLQTPRGSGTNGYIQTNKFFVKPKTGKVAHDIRGFEGDQGTAGISKKPNKEILEHDRKRQIELKLVVLEDKLIEQGYTDAEIQEKVDEARKTLEAFAAASEESGGPTALGVSETKLSDTQSHQIAARKEKQMETLRAAFGISVAEPGEIIADDNDDGLLNRERREHAFLDRDYSRKKHTGEAKVEMDDKKKKNKEKNEFDDSKHYKKRERSKRSQKDLSDTETDTDSEYDKKNRVSKNHEKRRRHDSDSDNSASGDDIKFDSGKKEKKNRTEKSMKSRRYGSDSDDSDNDDGRDSDDGRKRRKNRTEKSMKSRKHNGIDDSARDDSSDSDIGRKKKNKTLEKSTKSRRYESDNDDGSDSDGGKMKKKRTMDRPIKTSRDDNDSTDSDDGKKKRSNLGRPMRSRRHDGDSADSDDGKVKKREKPMKSRRHDSDSDGSASDGSTDSHNMKKMKETLVKYEGSRRRGNSTDDYATHNDVGKVTSRKEAEKYKKNHERHASGADSKFEFNSSKDRTSEVKQLMKRRHDSEDDSDIDGEVERSRSLYGKLKSQQEGSSKLVGDDYNLVDRWKSGDSGEKSSRIQIKDVEPQRETRVDRNYEGRERHAKDETDRKRGRYQRDDTDIEYGKRGKDNDDKQHGNQSRARVEEEERGSRGRDSWNYEDHGREKRLRHDEEDHKEKRYKRDEEHDDKYGRHGKVSEDNNDKYGRHGKVSENHDDKYGRHGKVSEDQRNGSRRRGRGEEEELGTKSHEKDKEMDYSKKARYAESRPSERKRYESDKHDEGRARY